MIQNDELFPVLKKYSYFAHAQLSPLPKPTADAISEYAKIFSQHGQFGKYREQFERSCRQYLADITGLSRNEIALIGPTSLTTGVVANSLSLQEGDSVIINKNDFISNVAPWLSLRKKGINVIEAPIVDNNIDIKELDQLIDRSTKVVALSWVDHVTGNRINIEKIYDYLVSKGVLLFVDAIQGLGAVDLPKGCFDVLVADSYKWLLGPTSIGVLAVKKSSMDKLVPVFTGWHSYIDDDVDPTSDNLKSNAEIFEPGTLNSLGIIGLSKSLEILQNQKIYNIQSKLEYICGEIVEGMLSKGYLVLGVKGNNWKFSSGIVSFYHKYKDVCQVKKHLENEDVLVSLKKHTASGYFCIRIAPHFYQTDNNVRKLIDNV